MPMKKYALGIQVSSEGWGYRWRDVDFEGEGREPAQRLVWQRGSKGKEEGL